MSIRAENLSVDLGGTRIISAITFAVPTGGRATLLGSNGSGKTTLLKTLLGLYPPAVGRAWVDDREVGSPTWRRERHRIGYVNQHAVQSAFPIAVAEVVALGVSALSVSRGERARRIQAAMERTGCAHLRRAPYARLSGGEKQRVSIARCLCQEPQTLLLDEPTASLDPEGKETLITLADELSATLGLTILLVSHDVAHFRRPGWQPLMLEAGRLVPADAPV